jgi:hypothetical protein
MNMVDSKGIYLLFNPINMSNINNPHANEEIKIWKRQLVYTDTEIHSPEKTNVIKQETIKKTKELKKEVESTEAKYKVWKKLNYDFRDWKMEKITITWVNKEKIFWKDILVIKTDFDGFTIFIDTKTWENLKLNNGEKVSPVFHSRSLSDNKTVLKWTEYYIVSIEDRGALLFDKNWILADGLHIKWKNEKISKATVDKEYSKIFKRTVSEVETDKWEVRFIDAQTLEEIKISWTDIKLSNRKELSHMNIWWKDILNLKMQNWWSETNIYLDSVSLEPLKVWKSLIEMINYSYIDYHSWRALKVILQNQKTSDKECYIDEKTLKKVNIKTSVLNKFGI